jgi:hypothetical protein
MKNKIKMTEREVTQLDWDLRVEAEFKEWYKKLPNLSCEAAGRYMGVKKCNWTTEQRSATALRLGMSLSQYEKTSLVDDYSQCFTQWED